MRTRGFRLALLALAALALLASCSGEARREEELRIGLLAPLSLPERFTAHLLAQARVDELNAAGGLEVGGRRLRVRLVVADSAPTLEQLMSATGRLVRQERVSAVIGPSYSREAIPAGAALEGLGVLMITPTASNPEVTRGRSFAFRVCMADDAQGLALARYAYETLGLRRAAVLYDEADAYSSGLAEFFRSAFQVYPGASLRMEGYHSGEQDFSAQLARIRAFGAQVLLLPNFPRDLAMQAQQARAAGFRGQFLGGDSWDTDPALHGLPEVQGAVFSTHFSEAAATPELLARARALAARDGVELSKTGALTLDALELLFAAARRAGSVDPVSLRSGLAGLRGLRGLTGEISFSQGGDAERAACIVGIQGGREILRLHLPPAGLR